MSGVNLMFLCHIEIGDLWWVLLVLLVALGLFFGVTLAWINRAIRRLVNASRKLAQGDLSARVELRGPLHLSDLSETMNQMARQLDDRLSTVVRQRNELGAVLSSMVEGVMAIDTEERVISINRAGCRMLGQIPTQIIGKSIQEVVRNTTLQQILEQTLRETKAMQGEALLWVSSESKPGEERYIQVQTGLLKDGQGKQLGAVLVLHDVTKLRRLESVRRDFVSNVSHEVKTPVSAIKAAIETLVENPELPAETSATFMQIIQRQADRMDAIVEDLLALARLEEEGRSRTEMYPEPLEPVIHHAIETCSAKAQDNAITVLTELQPGLHAEINAPLLEQAVVNLIDNAVKYSPEGTTVLVRTRRDGAEAIIEVQDEGRGIEPHHLPRIFERFYRTDRARSREMGGTGLGLAIVKHVAESHGGRVSVDSFPGTGSIFRIHVVSVAGEGEEIPDPETHDFPEPDAHPVVSSAKS